MRIQQSFLCLGIVFCASTALAADPVFTADQRSAWLAAGGRCYNHDELTHSKQYFDSVFISLSGTMAAPRRPVPNLRCWLDSEMGIKVRNAIVWDGVAYEYWDFVDPTMKTDLDSAFASAWNHFDSAFQTEYQTLRTERDATGNIPNVEAGFPSTNQTAFSQQNAYRLYIGHVALMLASELGNWYRWTLRNYTPEQLALLFNSGGYFERSSVYNIPSGAFYLAHRPTRPAGIYSTGTFTPDEAVEVFYYINRRLGIRALVNTGHNSTVHAAIGWARDHLLHFTGVPDRANFEAIWGYPGNPPFFDVFARRHIDPGQASYGLQHYTPGCHGTVGLLKSVLRVMNIPVDIRMHDGHAIALFPTINRYLSHGDDVYGRLWRDESVAVSTTARQPLPIQTPPPTIYLTRPMSEYAGYFPSENYGDTAQQPWVGYAVQLAALREAKKANPSRLLLQAYCDDLDANAVRASGKVAQHFNYFRGPHPDLSNFSVHETELYAGLSKRLSQVYEKCKGVRSQGIPALKGEYQGYEVTYNPGEQVHLKGFACAYQSATPVTVDAYMETPTGAVHIGSAKATWSSDAATRTKCGSGIVGWHHYSLTVKMDTPGFRKGVRVRLIGGFGAALNAPQNSGLLQDWFTLNW